MDSGEDEDGSLREHAELASPAEQLHIQCERCRAVAEFRLAFTDRAAYHGVPLAGLFQEAFSAYCQRSGFGRFGDASQLVSGRDAALPASQARSSRSSRPITLQPRVKIFRPMRNTEHDCTATCIEYMINVMEAKQSLFSQKVLSCRFWYL